MRFDEIIELKKKSCVEIDKAVYEVIDLRLEADIGLKPKFIPEKMAVIYLHAIGDKSILPTHQLWIHLRTKETFFIDVATMKKTRIKRAKIKSVSES